METAETELDAVADSAADARRFVRRTLLAWGCEAYVDDVMFLANELATNAILHAGGRVTVRLRRLPARIRCEVCDGNQEGPVVRTYAADDLTGRGLAIVVAIAAAWGVDRSATGKCVWFEVAT